MVVHRVVLEQDSNGLELHVERPFGDSGLPDVCSVEVVHTVRPHCAELPLDRVWAPCIDPEVSGIDRNSMSIKFMQMLGGIEVGD